MNTSKWLLLLIATFYFNTGSCQIDLSFLEGCWKVSGKDIYENWERQADGNLQGEGFSLAEGYKEVSEKLRITIQGEVATYTAIVFNQNNGRGVDFEFKKLPGNIYSFQNAAHDFPKKINYKSINTDELFVEVLGSGDKGFSFTLNRVPYPYSIPSWFTHLNNQSLGIWLADNSKYKSPDEPFDAYGIEWQWGLGQTSIKGRLFGVINGQDEGDFWEFRQYWDNENQQAIIQQFGSRGSLGIGSIIPIDKKGGYESIQNFSEANGPILIEKHLKRFKDGKLTTTSFQKWPDGDWKENRTYIWVKQQKAIPKAPGKGSN